LTGILKTVESFGIKNDGVGLDYFIAEEDRVKESDIPTSHHAGYVGISYRGCIEYKKVPDA